MSDRLAAALVELAAAIRADVRTELEATSPTPDRLLNVDEAAAALGIGRTAVYNLIAAGRLKSVTSGRRRLVSTGAIATYIASLEAEA